MQNINFELQKALLILNFTEKEANVYLACLELGKGTVSQIARHANINRTHGYNILDTLANRGLVIISGKEPKQEYAAESPEKIKEMIRNEIKKNEAYLKEADAIIPKLKSIHNVKGRPQIRFYEGEKGIEEVYEDTLTSKGEILAYAMVEDVHNTLPDYFPKYYFRRAQKNIPIRAIFPNTPAAKELTKDNKIQKRQTALVPADKYSFSPEINIYDNKVMIASWKEKLGIIIESGEVADAMKKIFELAWAEAKRLEKSSA
ncbi:MAG: helix-turn-helix domain-containing protein [Candidatus Doudnabacteria bacterium]|jgi:sugar-specific transcriptional regulator TrmB